MKDHAIVEIVWKVNTTNTYDDLFRSPATASAALAQWNNPATLHTGK